MLAKIGINATFVKFFFFNKQISRSYALQCSNISSKFPPKRGTFLPCWMKTFQHVRLEPELLLWLPEFQPSSRVANSRKRSFSLYQTLLPLSSVKAPAGYPYKIQKIERAWETMGPGEGGTPPIKWVGMLVVSLRGVNFGFWSHLGCSGQNAIIFSREGLD